MKVTRLDLDGTGSPTGLVTKILKAEPTLPVPVPIEDLAYQLDIGEIGELSTEGFEGGLLTDDVRSFGGILVRKGMDPRRRRFTIGHELGHFLLPFHKPAKVGQFLCSRADMMRWTAKEQDRAAKMEVEANLFSSLILMPPPHLRTFLRKTGEPSLNSVLAVHEQYMVSKEAAARAYVEYHDEAIAIAIVRDGLIQRIYRGRSFPRLGVARGDTLPLTTKVQGGIGTISEMREAQAAHWLESDFGVALPALYQQTLVQSNGFAMVLLWPETPDEDEIDPDEDKTSKQRYAERMSKRW
jgi:hypothetical protein